MPDQTAPDAEHEALGRMLDIFADQATVLDRIFYRAAKDGFSGSPRTHRDIRKALKAQGLCRTTFKVLFALRAAEEASKKISNSNVRTIESGKSPT